MIPRRLADSFREIFHAAKTTAFRFSLLFTLVTSIITGASMVMIYQTARQEISEQIDSRLFSEAIRLRRVYEYRATLDLYSPSTGITERVQTEPAMSYCLTQNPASTDTPPGRESRNVVMIDTSFSDLCILHNQLQTDTPGVVDSNLPVRADENNLMRVITTPMQNGYALVVGYDTRNEQRILRRMLNMAGFVTAILILASFFGSFFISRTITNSAQRISQTARLIVDGDFSERIEIGKSDSNELKNLAGDLNHMLERIEALIISQRQVTNNIAHDLRSPLNRLRSRMEVALLDNQLSNDDLRNVLSQSIEDAQNLLKTFNSLLTIAQVEAKARDNFKVISISQIAEDIAEMYEAFIEEGVHHFDSRIENYLHVMGDRQQIAQAITNLLDNAVKYTPDGGNIGLEAYRDEENIVIAVKDNGKGIPEDQRERVLSRFVRLDNARSTPGNGLGLSLVNAIMTRHNGRIELKDNHPGLRIELILPDVKTFTARHRKTPPAPTVRKKRDPRKLSSANPA